MNPTQPSIRRSILAVTLASAAAVTACRQPAPDNGALIYEGFGNYERVISTEVAPAQEWFNQGMQLMYGFNHDEAYAILREGVAFEDALVYDEPPGWMLPVRHALGALLMADGRYAEAEEVYLEDLRRNRDNGWSLTGLQLAMKAQDRNDEADELSPRLARAFGTADTRPSSSCYCEP